jgi:hypothetical protein
MPKQTVAAAANTERLMDVAEVEDEDEEDLGGLLMTE